MAERTLFSISRTVDACDFQLSNNEIYVDFLESANGTVVIDGKEYRTPIEDPNYDSTDPRHQPLVFLGHADGREYYSLRGDVTVTIAANTVDAEYQTETRLLSNELTIKLIKGGSQELLGLTDEQYANLGVDFTNDNMSLLKVKEISTYDPVANPTWIDLAIADAANTVSANT
jgi:hypothetical protein